MYKINILLLTTCVLRAESASVEGKIANYFKSDVFQSFQKQWQAHRKSFENAIQLALKENFGFRGMNVYVRRSPDSLRISEGFHTTDNVVDVLLSDLSLTSLPHLVMPEVTFALASNVLRVESGLSKMIIETKYHLYRNQSDILYTAVQDPFQNSPFCYQQVENVGQLAIVAEDCTLAGFTLTRLSGHSINLGHDNFAVKNCKFSIEISPNRNQGPPVIAPYFSQDQGKQMQTLITRPLRDELIPKLQAAVFSYINTSLIFGEYLQKIREYQDEIFKDTIEDITDLVKKINNKTVELNEETVGLELEKVTSNYKCQEGFCQNGIEVYKVTLHGLDTLYSAHSGGPYKLQLSKISEAFRFNSILVRGTLRIENNTLTGQHTFVAEIKDMAVNVELDIDKNNPHFNITNWRTLEISVSDLENDINKRKMATAFITGYIINKLPKVLGAHLINMFDRLKGIESNSDVIVPTQGDQKLGVNVNCNNIGGGWGGGYLVPAYGYWG